MAGVTHIIDYGMGNVRSVANAFAAVGGECAIVSDPKCLCGASRIVLPGVGAFADGMRNLREGHWIEALTAEVIGKHKPFLGICLGMQLIATTGTEHEVLGGLDWVPGTVRRIEPLHPETRVPHVGWNDVSVRSGAALYAGLGESETFYFVHSYGLCPEDDAVISGSVDYDSPIVASIEFENIHATQFHPEKSLRAGLQLLRNFVAMS